MDYLKVRICLVLVGAGLMVGVARAVPQGEPAPCTAKRVVTITSSGTFYLTNNVTKVTVQCPDNKTDIEVCLDLNGYSVTNKTSGSLITVGNGALKDYEGITYLTLTNDVDKPMSYIDGYGYSWTGGAGRGIFNNENGFVRMGGEITIRRCKVTETGDAKGGGGICNLGTFYMTGGYIGDASTTNKNGVCVSGGNYGGGICNYQKQAKFFLTGGKIRYCSCARYGGGVASEYDGAQMTIGGGPGKVIISHNHAPCGGGVSFGQSSCLTLTNGVEISSNYSTGTDGGNFDSGGGISVGLGQGTGANPMVNTLNMYGGSIVSNWTTKASDVPENMGGAGIFMRGARGNGKGAINIYGGLIAYNTTPDNGGGIFTKGPVYIYGGTIRDNDASRDGGGVYVANTTGSAEFVMEDGEISSNRAYRNGGGVYASYETSVLGGVISNNVATADGGGVYAKAQTTVAGGVVNNNVAGKDGGGVFIVKNASAFNMTGGTLMGNVATNNGGAFAVNVAKGKVVSISGGLVQGNTALKNGGGFWYSTTGTEIAKTNELTGAARVIGNAAVDGGGFFLTNTILTVEGGSVVSNTASSRGGGICAENGSDLTLDGGVVRDNTAGESGGGFFARLSSVELKGSIDVSGNHAGGDGGGLAIVCADKAGKGNSSKTLSLEGGSVSGNVADGNGGGFWVKGRGNTTSSISGDIFVRNNIARNGGGFYLQDSAYLNIDGGIVYLNEAKSDVSTNDFDTVYAPRLAADHVDREVIRGCGGGFYLAPGTNISKVAYDTVINFTATNSIGIYLNVASNAADDILAEGLYAVVTNIPKVADMELQYAGGAMATGWSEDYCVGDLAYTNGTHVITDEGYQAERCRTRLARNDRSGGVDDLLVASNNTWRSYLCITLGFYFPMPGYLWITDHEDVGNGEVNLRFQPVFTNEYARSQGAFIPVWAESAIAKNHLFVGWGDTPRELKDHIEAHDGSGNETDFTRLVRLRNEDKERDCTDGQVWVRVPLRGKKGGGSEPEPLGDTTNRYYQIFVTKSGDEK